MTTTSKALDRAPPPEDRALTERKERFRSVRDFILSRKTQIADLATRTLDTERLLKIGLDAAARTPAILQCTPESLLAAMIFCAKVGLEPIGKWGVYLVPFKGEVVPIIDYRALIALVTKHGDIESVHTGAVYADDVLEFELGDEPKIRHIPRRPRDRAEGEARGDLEATYAVATLRSGRKIRHLMWREDIDRVRGRSRASSTGPWVTDFEAMAIKTAVRGLCSRLPVHIDAQRTLAADDEADNPSISVQAVDVTDRIAEAQPAERPAEARALPAPAPAPAPEPPPAEPPKQRTKRAQQLLDEHRPAPPPVAAHAPEPPPTEAPRDPRLDAAPPVTLDDIPAAPHEPELSEDDEERMRSDLSAAQQELLERLGKDAARAAWNGPGGVSPMQPGDAGSRAAWELRLKQAKAVVDLARLSRDVVPQLRREVLALKGGELALRRLKDSMADPMKLGAAGAAELVSGLETLIAQLTGVARAPAPKTKRTKQPEAAPPWDDLPTPDEPGANG